jgi:hypothetical protein
MPLTDAGSVSELPLQRSWFWSETRMWVLNDNRPRHAASAGNVVYFFRS